MHTSVHYNILNRWLLPTRSGGHQIIRNLLHFIVRYQEWRRKSRIRNFANIHLHRFLTQLLHYIWMHVNMRYLGNQFQQTISRLREGPTRNYIRDILQGKTEGIWVPCCRDTCNWCLYCLQLGIVLCGMGNRGSNKWFNDICFFCCSCRNNNF